MVYGSEKVWSLLFNEDSKFSSFVTQPRLSVTTLPAAIERARNEILAHYDRKARELDEEKWRAVGGPVHLATITPGEGFNWVPGFAPGLASHSDTSHT